MDNYDNLFKAIMKETFISASLNYESYKDRSDDELDGEEKDLKKQDPKHFRANIGKKISDIQKEKDRRKQSKDK
jgi:hypothetical protein